MQDITQFARELDAELSGSVSLPGQPGYDSAVLVWARPKALPRVVAHCLTEADVQTAVRAARRAARRRPRRRARRSPRPARTRSPTPRWAT